MVDALDSKSNVLLRVGSSPTPGKKPGNIMVVCGPAKSEVWVRVPSWFWLRDGIGRHVVFRLRFLWVRVPPKPEVNPSSNRSGLRTFYAEIRVRVP